jgi:hypothetical protein
LKIIYYLQLCLFFLLFLTSRLDASCCSSSSVGGIQRLLAHERALIDLSTSFRYTFADFDHQGNLQKHPSYLPFLTIVYEIQAMTRLFDFFEPYFIVPLRLQISDQSRGANMGDISLGARFLVFKENIFALAPGLTLFASARLPTGAYPKTGQMLAIEDITGTGYYLYSAGCLLEKNIKNITYGLSYFFSSTSDFLLRKTTRPGAIHSPSVTMGYSMDEKGNFSLAISGVFYSLDYARMRPIEDSDRRKVSMAIGYLFPWHSHVKLHAQLGVDVPLPYFSKNFNEEVFLRLSMRLGVF